MLKDGARLARLICYQTRIAQAKLIKVQMYEF